VGRQLNTNERVVLPRGQGGRRQREGGTPKGSRRSSPRRGCCSQKKGSRRWVTRASGDLPLRRVDTRQSWWECRGATLLYVGALARGGSCSSMRASRLRREGPSGVVCGAQSPPKGHPTGLHPTRLHPTSTSTSFPSSPPHPCARRRSFLVAAKLPPNGPSHPQPETRRAHFPDMHPLSPNPRRVHARPALRDARPCAFVGPAHAASPSPHFSALTALRFLPPPRAIRHTFQPVRASRDEGVPTPP